MAARLLKNPPATLFKGSLFSLLNQSNQIKVDHPLDTNREQYYQVLNNLVIPACVEFAPDIAGYPDYFKKFISYANPAFHPGICFAAELAYRMSAAPEQQCDGNLVKMRVLRALMDMKLSYLSVIDDITDNTQMRRNKKTWHTIAPGGMYAAIYDGIALGHLGPLLLKKFFRSDQGYPKMLEAIAKCDLEMMMSQGIDTVQQEREATSCSQEEYEKLLMHKGGYTLSASAVLGMLHAGILEDKLIQQVSNVFYACGIFFSVWDDFSDYYTTDEVRGKEVTNYNNTWLSSCAAHYFNDQQSQRFSELNEKIRNTAASENQSEVEEIKRLFDDINLPRIYVSYLRAKYLDLKPKIEAIPDVRLRNVCNSYVEWLIFDVCDPCYTDKLLDI